MEKVVLAENITYSYGDTLAVDNVSFHIRKGSILGFLGPNGAGKTTALKMLTGLLPPQKGTIQILGLDY
ncbi:MAG: ATP-binding cassette domain-containing protein, partial [Actinomycetia bacterium]|nr:ATP-binding cassette domain-containing protein [Actinomycetes bacterium]